MEILYTVLTCFTEYDIAHKALIPSFYKTWIYKIKIHHMIMEYISFCANDFVYRYPLFEAYFAFLFAVVILAMIHKHS